MNPRSKKDVVYVDAEDEITTIIDKVRTAEQKIVALVLPKRAAMLQSIVNLKLLKRAAEQENRRLVLITPEAGLMPLAGSVGLHVAKTLQSKPEIPPAPETVDGAGGQAENALATDEPSLDPTRPVGELAAASGVDDAIELDNEPSDTEQDTESGFADGKAGEAKTKKGSKFKIPNFESFRTRLLLGGLGLVLLIIGWYAAVYVMPKANVLVRTDSSQITSNITMTASTEATAVDEERSIVPAVNKELRKTDVTTAGATGQKDKGTKASGEITLSLKDCSVEEVTVPAGTGVSSNNLTFITQNSATLSSVQIGSDCRNSDFPDFSTEVVEVTAQNPGDQYNLNAGQDFTVAGFSSVSGSNEAAMSGGTSRMVKVVTEQDIDNARKRLSDKNKEAAKNELIEQLQKENYLVLEDTFHESSPAVTSSPSAGDEADEVSVTFVAVYRMFGVKEADLIQIVEKSTEHEIDHEQQTILDHGVADAEFEVRSRDGNRAQVSFTTLVKAGPELDEAAIKQEVAGKKKGEAQALIERRPGIYSVEVKYSPFWVATAPKDLNKITVNFEAQDQQRTDER